MWLSCAPHTRGVSVSPQSTVVGEPPPHLPRPETLEEVMRATERIVDLKNFLMTGYYGNSLAIAPDDSPLLLRDAGTQDVYALDWEEP
jgi:hypothetical protein